MIRTGLHRIEQLSALKYSKNLFGRDRQISVTLYDQTAAIANGDEWAERILRRFRDRRGVYKRTYGRRFDDFDALALQHVAETFGNDRALVVHDAGVSDARTACDFFRKIAAGFADVTYYASDYEPELRVLQSRNIKATLNKRGEVLEIVLPPFVFPFSERDQTLRRPVNYAFFHLARAVYLPRVLAAYRAGQVQPRLLLLFCPEAMRLADSDHRFRLLQHDLLGPAPFPHQVDVVRAMNVLNSEYFTPQQFREIADRIFASLADGGLLLVGSNHFAGTPVHGAIYRKTGRAFAELARSGDTHDAHQAIMDYSSPY
jgi:hypothetical protein